MLPRLGNQAHRPLPQLSGIPPPRPCMTPSHPSQGLESPDTPGRFRASGGIELPGSLEEAAIKMRASTDVDLCEHLAHCQREVRLCAADDLDDTCG
jgi:hypothetical protein